jgi:hypothetical protein
MRHALLILSLGVLGAWLPRPAAAVTACAWIVETVEEGGAHKFALNLSADAPVSVAVRFRGANFTSASMGGEMIPLEAGEAKEVDGEGFEVDAGDDIRFDAELYDRPMATLEEMDEPKGKELAAFVFERKVGEGETAPPAALAAKQCKPLG